MGGVKSPYFNITMVLTRGMLIIQRYPLKRETELPKGRQLQRPVEQAKQNKTNFTLKYFYMVSQ
jgi:hypothetical protein